jgi:hypothetical protein
MADPRDSEAVCRLAEATGMVVFPVSCEVDLLDLLLARGW